MVMAMITPSLSHKGKKRGDPYREQVKHIQIRKPAPLVTTEVIASLHSISRKGVDVAMTTISTSLSRKRGGMCGHDHPFPPH